MNCQTFSTGFSSGDLGGKGQKRDVVWHFQSLGAMPAGLIEQDDSVGAWFDGP